MARKDKHLPATFKVLATNKTFEGICAAVAKFYGGEGKEITEITSDASPCRVYEIFNPSDHRDLHTRVLRTAKGFYFGHF